ncbi:thioesterase II family protein [Pelosinus fermentans]|uniref:Oleoyl-(Acyl-carrier-protein) hydrolase n=1 Tax=Pelosinus fermentans JBW45 TaxID=1192197 RepID=I9NRQ1_9FIRM|nr:alpha/beta fold hydrolase [Pelosinus fermentans]AJQ26608.1 Oleoyl-(acyl-carrier-protein) hydrolase [Pelosinus fermentans JBW45]
MNFSKTKKIKLFCLPYAGGLSSFYNKWNKCLSEYIDICPIEYPGRGRRVKDPLYGNFDDALKDIYQSIFKELNTDNYALFGHSLGCVLAYEFACWMKAEKQVIPKHIFLSGAHPPNSFKDNMFNLHTLPDDEFIEEIFRYGGTMKQILSERKMLSAFIPIIRADCKAFETYREVPKIDKLNCDITVLTGKDDEIALLESTAKWQIRFNGSYKRYLFDGGHFFINGNTEKIVKIVNETLINYV